MSDTNDIPIACALSEPELARRTAELETLIFAAVEAVAEIADGYAFRFPAAEIWLERLAGFVAAERRCCPFFRFEVVAEPGMGPIWLRLRGAEGVKAFVAAQFLPAVAPARPPAVTAGAGVPLAAFLDSDYVVIDGGREVVVRIGRASAELNALLVRHGAGHGVFITGWNPLSRAQPPALNAAANVRMMQEFAGRAVAALPHVGRGGDGAWAEHGFFALDLDREEALALAVAFGQFAIVLAVYEEPAALLLTTLAESPGASG